MIGGVVLDTTGLHDIVTGATIYGQAFVTAAVERGDVLLVPSSCLAQAAATLEGGVLPVLHLLLEMPVTVVDPLDERAALACGARIRSVEGGERRTVDAHVVHAARTRGWRVFTRAPERLWEIDVQVLVETPLPE